MLLTEPGAILCRVSRSYLRFGQLELFAIREEYDQLVQLADYVCFREYPELLDITIPLHGSEADVHISDTSKNEADIHISDTFNNRKDTNILKSTEYKDSNSSITEQTPQLLLPTRLIPGPVERYIELYRLITQRTARLVAHWLRVGYIQGNMNSDNILLSGVTIDYGPYGWMEQYDRNYQPFTGDKRGDFAYAQQSEAMGVNVKVLGTSW